MFNATKFVFAGAIVALFGGFLLAGVLTGPSGDLSPAAVTDSAVDGTSAQPTSAKAVDFSGDYPYLSAQGGEMSLLADGFVVMGEQIDGVLTELDDHRLNGKVRYVVNRIDHESAGDVVSYVVRIDNDGGSWLGTGYGYNDTADPGFVFDHGNRMRGGFDTTVLRGSGGYEGLSAIMVNERAGDTFRVEGVVFSGEIAELPEMPAAPAE
jgi:hypothetical protein